MKIMQLLQDTLKCPTCGKSRFVKAASFKGHGTGQHGQAHKSVYDGRSACDCVGGSILTTKSPAHGAGGNKRKEIMTRYEKTAKMLCSNDMGWYAVTYDDNKLKLVHETSLSNILQCGDDMGDYGIVSMIRCGARDIDEAYEWLGEA